MSRLPPLHALAHFEAVARLGTVAAAAKELKVSPSAVSHQIRTLETALGVSLFQRVNRRLIPTEDGEEVFASASEALDLLRQTRRRLERTADRHRLSGRIAQSLAIFWLMPRLGDFIRAHPEIDLWIDASPNRSDFALEAVDFDIRYGTGEWQGLESELLLTDSYIPVASPDHPVFATKGKASKGKASKDGVAKRLAGASLLHTSVSRFQWSDWLAHNGITGFEPQHRLHFRTASLSIKAAEQGLGIALGESTLLLEPLTEGRLKPVFPDLASIETPAYWFVCPSRHLYRRPVTLFRSWVREQAKAYEDAMRVYLNGETE